MKVIGSKIDVDKLLRTLGKPGRYQIIIYVLLWFNYLPVSFNHVVMALYKYVPVHYCKPFAFVGNCSDSFLTNESCQIQYQNISSREYDTYSCQNGYVYNWSDGPEETISTEWDLVCEKRHLPSQVTSIYFAGVMLGGLIFGTLSDKFGRKPVLLICLYVHIVIGLGIYLLNSFLGFVLLRFAQGFMLQGLQAVAFVMAMELSVTEYKTYVGVITECFWSFGVMLLALVGYLLRDWRHIQLAITLPSLITIIYIWLVPESLRWLLASGRYAHGKQVMKWMAGKNKVKFPEYMWYSFLGVYEDDSVKGPSHPYTLLDMLRTRTLRKHSLIMFYIWWCCALVYYGLTLGTADLAGNRYLNLFLSGLVEMPAYVSSIYILSRFGRKYPLLIYFILSGVGCILSAVLPDATSSLVLALVGKFAVAGCLSIIFLYATELFPTLIRNVAFGACAFWLRVGALLAPQINSLDVSYHSGAPAIVFGCSALVGALLTMLLPETRDKCLPDSIAEAEVLGFLCKGSVRGDLRKEDSEPDFLVIPLQVMAEPEETRDDS